MTKDKKVLREVFKDWDDYQVFLEELPKMEDRVRLLAILKRYPMGSTIRAIQGVMGMGRTQKARRKIDGMLRRLEDAGSAHVVRAGMDGEVRLWAYGPGRRS